MGGSPLHELQVACRWVSQLRVPWSLRPRNRRGCGDLRRWSLRCSCDFVAAGEAETPAISAAEWLRARLRPVTVVTAILRCDFCAAKFPDLDSSNLSFFALLGFSRLGIFPIMSGRSILFPSLSACQSTYKEHSGKGPRHNQTQDLSRKKWETPRLGNPPV